MKTIVKRLALMLCCAGLFLASCSDDEASDAQRTLMEVIREAETLVAEVEEGTSEFDIAPGSKKILQAWIDQAYFIMNNTSREEGYANAAKRLEEAIAAFNANIVKPGIVRVNDVP